ncbi:MAG: hypothetical protein HC905_13195 [Bacteroidales bacterium]|nr:hypothetical protein [Bacteroidales bacterium]
MGDSVTARLASNFGTASFNGNVSFQELPGMMKAYFNRYFLTETSDSVNYSDKFFNAGLTFKDPSVLNDFMNLNITMPKEAKITADFRDDNFSVHAGIENLVYNDIEIEDLNLEAAGKDSSFKIDFKTQALKNNVQTIHDLSLESNLKAGDLNTRIAFSNASDKKWFNIGFTMEPGNPELNVVLEEPLLLNYQDWNVDKQNKTYIKNKNIVFDQVKLSSDEKLISLLSDAQRPEKLVASFKNLSLALVSELMKGDTSFITGKIDGDIMATNLFARPVPVFDVNFNISDIIVQEKILGNLNIDASNLENNDIAALNVDFGQKNMLFNLKGTYGLTKEIPMDLNLSAKDMDLAAIQPLIADVISDASGFINATLNLKGSFNNPELRAISVLIKPQLLSKQFSRNLP